MLSFAVLQPQSISAGEVVYKNLDSAAYQKAIEGIDYSEKPEKEKEEKEQRTPPKFDFSALPGIIKVISMVVGGFLIAWLISQLFFLLMNQSSNGKVNLVEEIHIDNLEEYIHETDLEQFLKDALQRNDYTAAIRIYYLMIIKSLSEENKILWKKGKTNQEYLNELKSDSLYEKFASNTYLYEKIWYGDISIDAQKFEQVAEVFKSFLGQIKVVNGGQ